MYIEWQWIISQRWWVGNCNDNTLEGGKVVCELILLQLFYNSSTLLLHCHKRPFLLFCYWVLSWNSNLWVKGLLLFQALNVVLLDVSCGELSTECCFSTVKTCSTKSGLSTADLILSECLNLVVLRGTEQSKTFLHCWLINYCFSCNCKESPSQSRHEQSLLAHCLLCNLLSCACPSLILLIFFYCLIHGINFVSWVCSFLCWVLLYYFVAI